MLPLPYGLLPHEMIETVDNERVIPGLTKIFKLAEDFPYLDHHSLNKENQEYEIFHQRAFIFNDFPADNKRPLHNLLKNLPSFNEPLMKFTHLHHLRFTFVSNLFGKEHLLNV